MIEESVSQFLDNLLTKIRQRFKGSSVSKIPTQYSQTTFEFLPDKPIQENENDALFFGYDEIAKALAEIVKKVPVPFSIGLFGKWGMGKSTLLLRLKKFLNDDFIFTTFDVWKYESDALRRSFLLDLTHQLKESGQLKEVDFNKIREKLYFDISEPKEILGFSWRGLALFALTVSAVLFLQFAFAPTVPLLNKVVLSALSGGIFSLADFLKSCVYVDKITIGKERINSPEAFCEEFWNILTKINGKRLVIGIDNLDRVDRDKAVEVLSTIKTFLSDEKRGDNIIFIIACDDIAIKEHIKTKYGAQQSDSEFNSDEFLRKFFNAILRVPKFLGLELDEYTKEELKKTNVPSFRKIELQLIINDVYRDNPREIKQFINNLLSYYILATERGEKENIDQKFIEKNLPFIAKLLIIRQKFPKAYEEIENQTLAKGSTWEDIIRDTSILGLSQSDKPSFDDFLKNTAVTKPTTDNISVFLTLKRSKADKELPGWDQFRISAINKQPDAAVKIMKRLKRAG